jgi:hypothetical protein
MSAVLLEKHAVILIVTAQQTWDLVMNAAVQIIIALQKQ